MKISTVKKFAINSVILAPCFPSLGLDRVVGTAKKRHQREKVIDIWGKMRRLRSFVVVVVAFMASTSTANTVGVSSAGNPGGGATSFVYTAGGGRVGKSHGKDQVFAPSINAFHHQTPAYVEPRGDSSGGGYGGGGGGFGGGGGGYGGSGGGWGGYIGGGGGGGGQGGGGWGWGPPMYYMQESDDDASLKGLLGLLGLTGLTGLKGLLGLAALLKLLLPLLLLLLPLLLPLLLAKAGLLLALLLLIPVPVIAPGTGRNKVGGYESMAKAFLSDTVTDLMGKIPTDLSHIVGKIKDSEWFKSTFPTNTTNSKKDRKSLREKTMMIEEAQSQSKPMPSSGERSSSSDQVLAAAAASSAR